jgi:ATP-dependent 26S proteasome regulatory subunit
MVYKMSLEDPGGASFAGIGGLGEQVRELREVRRERPSVFKDLLPTYLVYIR